MLPSAQLASDAHSGEMLGRSDEVVSAHLTPDGALRQRNGLFGHSVTSAIALIDYRLRSVESNACIRSVVHAHDLIMVPCIGVVSGIIFHEVNDGGESAALVVSLCRLALASIRKRRSDDRIPEETQRLHGEINGVDWEIPRLVFHLKSNDRERCDRISIVGNYKQDYNQHFLLPEAKVPRGMLGELWLTGSNREDESISVLVSFA